MKIIKSAVFVFSISLALLSCKQSQSTEGDGEAFKTMKVQPSDVLLTNSYSASIRGRQDIKIIPRVDGYLTDILIKEGDRVRKGQTIFIIDQTAFKAALQAAQASVAVAKANVATAQLSYDSKKSLYEKKIVSNFDLESAQNALKTAQAQLLQAKAQEESARNNLSFTVIQSPSDGVAAKIPYRKGDYVGPSIPEGLTVVADNTQMYVYFSMGERQIMELLHQHRNISAAIAKMPEIQLQLSDGSVYEHKGKIESISGVIDPATGKASVRAAFPNPGGLLLSGGAGSVIVPYQGSQVIVIPQEATFEVQDKVYVFKVVDGVAVSSIVTVGKINNGKEYLVTSGLNAGDVVIAEGAGLVREGVRVKESAIKE